MQGAQHRQTSSYTRTSTLYVASHLEQQDFASPQINELCFDAKLGNTQLLLAAILRELSQSDDSRWLCLVGTPNLQLQSWLKKIDLKKERILLLQPKSGQSELELSCEALRLGRSHTVISWLTLDNTARTHLGKAAQLGNSQSLNIFLH